MNVKEALEIVSRTHPGMVRSHNEDSVTFDAAHGLVVLADGMGGYNAGEVASGIAVSVVSSEIRHRLEEVSPEEKDAASGMIWAWLCCVITSRKPIFRFLTLRRVNLSTPEWERLSSPRCFMTIAWQWLTWGIRACTVCAATCSKLSRAIIRCLQEQIDSGVISKELARLSKNKNLVTRAVGIEADVVPEVHVYDVQVGDVYLLCSDGLNDMVEDEDIAATLQMLQGNLALAANQLIEQANDNGGRDNVSVILVKIRGGYAAPRGWWAKLKSWFKN